MYGAISGDFSHFNQAWDVLDGYYVPEVQYNNEKYLVLLNCTENHRTFANFF